MKPEEFQAALNGCKTLNDVERLAASIADVDLTKLGADIGWFAVPVDGAQRPEPDLGGGLNDCLLAWSPDEFVYCDFYLDKPVIHRASLRDYVRNQP